MRQICPRCGGTSWHPTQDQDRACAQCGNIVYGGSVVSMDEAKVEAAGRRGRPQGNTGGKR